MQLTALPHLFHKLNKVFVMRLLFSEAVQKWGKSDRFFSFSFYFIFLELLCLQEREVRTNELLLHLDGISPFLQYISLRGMPFLLNYFQVEFLHGHSQEMGFRRGKT